MKLFNKILVFGLCFTVCVACVKNISVKAGIPMSGISLYSPENNSALNLDQGAESYTFSWKDTGEESYTVLFCADSYFSASTVNKPYAVEVGKTAEYEFPVGQLEIIMSEMNLMDTGMNTLYWCVKPTGKIERVAATEIHKLSMKHMHNSLTQPDDGAGYTLDAKSPETIVKFGWEENAETASGYELMFSKDMNFSNPVVIDAGDDNTADITHAQLQSVIENLNMELYTESKIYWNVRNKADGGNVSRVFKRINLTSMMIFNDLRGTETERYEVAKITLQDGTTQFWLGENLRTTKYPDGTDIESDKFIHKYSGDKATAEIVRLFGGYYAPSIKTKVAPKGWRLPKKEDYDNLLAAAKAQPEGRGVLMYDHQYFWKDADLGENDLEHMNEWNMNFVPAGNTLDGITFNNAMSKFTYFLLSDQEQSCLYDGWQYWSVDTGTAKCSLRFIYEGVSKDEN